MPKTVAKIAVEKTAYSFDMLFDYAVPENLSEKIVSGVRVMIPFGRGNNERMGIVFGVTDATDNKKLKNISSVLDDAPVLSDEMLKLAQWIKNRTFCTLYEAAKVMLPYGINHKLVGYYKFIKYPDTDTLNSVQLEILKYLDVRKKKCTKACVCDALGISKSTEELDELVNLGFVQYSSEAKRRVSDKTVRIIKLTENYSDIKLTPKQQRIVEVLQDTGDVPVSDLCAFTDCTSAYIQTMKNKGIVEIYEIEVLRNPYNDIDTVENREEIVLTEKQNIAFKGLLDNFNKNEGTVSLLYGVTGCGKTKVYMKLIDEAVKLNRGVIVMVPEISLTPQTLHLFHTRYGNNVAVFHSGLSVGERVDEWKRVNDGRAKIVVGTRSAIFAPVRNLGLIIIDEEQEFSYKSEKTPRYDAKEVAKYRCVYNKAELVLASATPSVETFAAAQNGIYNFYEIPERYGNAILPDVIVADMCENRRNGNTGNISEVLKNSIQENLDNSQQTMLLINRRGYNTFVACESCGNVITCPHCSISMNYHSYLGKLVCHYCGYTRDYMKVCEECGEENIRYAGVGTQKIEEELREYFPEASILRMDTDCVTNRLAYEKKLNAFKNGDYDILVGTQMIAKGLDFENVTLVGIISADQQLNNDDFRSLERTFSLLTQVIGRAGRGKYKGRAVIQTLVPENNIIKLAASQDYYGFFESEIDIRKMLTYPPFCDICYIGFSGEKENEVTAAAVRFLDNIKKISEEKYSEQKIIVLGPVEPRVFFVADRYKNQIIIKCKNSIRFRSMISELLINFAKYNENKNVSVYADINPE